MQKIILAWALNLLNLAGTGAFSSQSHLRTNAPKSPASASSVHLPTTRTLLPRRSFIYNSGIPRPSTTKQSLLISRMASDDSEDLLEAASRLRKEAEAMEESMKGRRKVDYSNAEVKTSLPPPAVYTSLGESSWIISYRFASDAVSKDDDDDDNAEVNDVKNTFYSGKLKIQLTNDGYTNMLEDKDGGDSQSGVSSKKIRFTKIWGWDEEQSKEDELDYLLFSADVIIPESDPKFENKPIRFYFQTQINRDSKTGEISLSDGTVTLKKDIKPPGGFWGVFNGGGILAQFRYCGEFLMKPL